MNYTFIIRCPDNLMLFIARFMASMFMHINVEKDVCRGIKYMKYCVNHYDSFTNIYAPFGLAFLHTVISLIVEFNVMMMLTC